MKALPALLALLAALTASATASSPEAPQSLPILYDQPGDRYILRIDNRRYQMPYATKEGIARLMSAANYPRTKLLYDEYKRALEEREKAEATIRRSQANLTRENERVARLSRSLESLRSQLALLRGLPNIDLNQLLFLQDQIRSTAAALAAAEAQEAKAAAALDRTQGSAEATLRRADEARDAYVAALTAYEKPLAEIRALAMSVGSAL
ncbi:MAG: hypothetical protein FJ384_06935 [Verrucomicrobia bacterium]|nr:hypothetical protein [Verrucomicrobiota bacterium]